MYIELRALSKICLKLFSRTIHVKHCICLDKRRSNALDSRNNAIGQTGQTRGIVNRPLIDTPMSRWDARDSRTGPTRSTSFPVYRNSSPRVFHRSRCSLITDRLFAQWENNWIYAFAFVQWRIEKDHTSVGLPARTRNSTRSYNHRKFDHYDLFFIFLFYSNVKSLIHALIWSVGLTRVPIWVKCLGTCRWNCYID